MKKILLAIFIVVATMLLSLTVFASEEESVNFSVSNAVASKGGETEISVDVSGNYGMAGVVITLDYDEEALSLLGWENGTVYSAQPTTGKNYVWTETKDNTYINGTLITFTFAVSEKAVEGQEYPVTIIVRECSDIDRNAVTTSVTAGSITVTKPESEISAVNMELGDDITMNYYAKIDSAHAGAMMRFTMNGKETFAEGEALGDGNYVFAFRGVAPQCMGDEVKAELILGDEVLALKDSYSVRDYCDELLASTAETLGISEAKFASLKVLVADMLEYGAAAQLYTGYKTGTLVNDGISGKSEFAELESTDKEVFESEAEGLEITGLGMYFDYTNSFFVNFTALGYAEDEMVVIVYNETTEEEREYTLAECVVLSEETGEYVLVTDAIFTTSYSDIYYIELYTYNSRGKLVCQQTVKYSVASYVFTMQNKTDSEGALTPMAKLARAVYLYGNSAAAYKAVVN